MASYQTEEHDLYGLLGISSNASKNHIKKAYHKAALQYHPDKATEDNKKESEQKFKEINRAYEILYDDEKRQLYDMYGMAAFDQSRGAPEMGADVDLEDIFRMFGMNGDIHSDFSGKSTYQRPRRGQDEDQSYQVTLEELYKGKTVKFASTKNVICSHCKGSGGKERAKPAKCDRCKGKGFKFGLASVAPNTVTQTVVTCDSCNGSGKIFKEKDRCKKCKGKQTVSEKKVLEIYIPKGSNTGDQIVLEGEGDQVPNQEPGDIIFTLDQVDHEAFSRFQNNLSTEIHITLTEALTGFDRVVLKHLDGRGIRINHPPGKIMKPGQTIKIKGEGMPIKKSDCKGDLFLFVKVDFPEENWAKNPSSLTSLRQLIPQSPPVFNVTEEDGVDYDANADPNELHEQSEEWESVNGDDNNDNDDGGGNMQCTQQ
ncbi:DnaJ protein-like protein xdj1 [Erysiphe neolycopersici]|uniref:DnaJ protein-like protein xdj1 n=1 Tax=Erysiphe neolycopersici TaxID=212602 RepID=A0A420HRA6_9PEZI|nr:DnaJ protein-like protein xdj1 [Erysiphe neolycopersici]